MKPLHFANLMLVIITIAWGLTFPVIKTVASDINPAVFVTMRFLIAAMMLLPFIQVQSLLSRHMILAGVVLGLLNSGVYFLQTLALDNLSAARCAFLTGTVVVWVPLFNYFLRRMRVKFNHVCAAILCLFGLWILTGADVHGIGIADAEMLLAEACFALSLLYIEKIGSDCSAPFTLTFYQIIFTCPLPLLMSLTTKAPWQPLLNFKVIAAVLFCAVFATFIAMVLQLKYQPRTTSIHAALIYSLEPFWAAVFASTIFGEVLTVPLVVGGSLMIFSVLLPEVMQFYHIQRTNLVLKP